MNSTVDHPRAGSTPSCLRITPRYLSKRDAASFCGVSIRCLDYARSRGALPYHQMGRKVLLDVNDLVAWLDSHRVGVAGQQESEGASS